ncbi:hypothetical protein J6590_067614 [Homalodisca vitripennis]|nr:hypothetical protein J6590_067614 [Homalodisca vitripennis]
MADSPNVTPTDSSPVPADKSWLFEPDRGIFNWIGSSSVDLDPVYRQVLKRSPLLLAKDFQHFAISEKRYRMLRCERWRGGKIPLLRLNTDQHRLLDIFRPPLWSDGAVCSQIDLCLARRTR